MRRDASQLTTKSCREFLEPGRRLKPRRAFARVGETSARQPAGRRRSAGARRMAESTSVAGAEEGEVAEVGAVEAEALRPFFAQHAAAEELFSALVALGVVAGDLEDGDVVGHAGYFRAGAYLLRPPLYY